MLACCLIGMGSVVAVTVFKVPINNVFLVLMLLICPLSHVLMMKMMMGHHHSDEQNQEHHRNPVVDTQAKPAPCSER